MTDRDDIIPKSRTDRDDLIEEIKKELGIGRVELRQEIKKELGIARVELRDDTSNEEVIRELKKELKTSQMEIEKLEKQIADLHRDLVNQSQSISALKAEVRVTMSLIIIMITALVIHGILK